MYSYEDRIRAVKLYIKLGKRMSVTLRQLGYPTKISLKGWYREFQQNGDLPTDPTAAQNRQDQKEAFLQSGTAETRNSGNLQLPASPYQVMAGTVIAAALVTGIKSDLPGDVIGTVTEPVYDSAIGMGHICGRKADTWLSHALLGGKRTREHIKNPLISGLSNVESQEVARAQ